MRDIVIHQDHDNDDSRAKISYWLWISVCILFLVGCGGRITPSSAGAIPRDEPPSPYGNPSSYKVFGNTYYVNTQSKGYKERGYASWYGKDFHGKRTSSGTPYNMHTYSAAHKTLPIPTYVRVTNLENNKQLIVRVDDRGPFKSERIIDLSFQAAKDLGVVAKGTAYVEVEAIQPYQDLGRQAVAPNPNKVAVATVVKAPQKAEKPIAITYPSSNEMPYLIQIGAFSDYKNALYLSEKIKSHTPYAVNIRGDHVHRVFVGPYPDTESVELAKNFLESVGFDAGKIVKQHNN